MTHRLAILALPFALAACTATAAGSITPSTSPSKAPSTTASKSPSSTPSTAAGADTITLTIDGKARTLPGSVKWTPTDLIGKRLRLSAMIGPDTPAGDEANVGFLFGGGGADMQMGWDTKASSAVFSVTVNYYDDVKKKVRNMALTTNTSSGSKDTIEARADGHIVGKLEGEAFPDPGLSSEPNTRLPFKLEFDLVQPPLDSKM